MARSLCASLPPMGGHGREPESRLPNLSTGGLYGVARLKPILMPKTLVPTQFGARMEQWVMCLRVRIHSLPTSMGKISVPTLPSMMALPPLLRFAPSNDPCQCDRAHAGKEYCHPRHHL